MKYAMSYQLMISLCSVVILCSLCPGIMNLARSGSMKLRNSLRRHGSVHKRDEHSVSQFSVSSSENLIAASVSPRSVADVQQSSSGGCGLYCPAWL